MSTPEAGGRAVSHPCAAVLRRFSERTGAVVAWLTVPMVVCTFLIALMRYAFAENWIWLQELVIWMHAIVFMLAAAYTLNLDAHVRVDIFYRQFSPRRQAWVELIGCLIFLLPVSAMLIAVSFDYVVTSWSRGEGSSEIGGLPYPFVPLLKTVIPLTFVLIAIQGVAMVLDAWVVLQRRSHTGDRD